MAQDSRAALLDVVTDRFDLVMPAHVIAAPIYGTALYSAKAVLHGHMKDVVAMVDHALRL